MDAQHNLVPGEVPTGPFLNAAQPQRKHDRVARLRRVEFNSGALGPPSDALLPLETPPAPSWFAGICLSLGTIETQYLKVRSRDPAILDASEPRIMGGQPAL